MWKKWILVSIRITNDSFSFQTGLMYWPFVQVSSQGDSEPFPAIEPSPVQPHCVWPQKEQCTCWVGNSAWSTNWALSPSHTAVKLHFDPSSPENSLHWALWLCLGFLHLLFPTEWRWHSKVSLHVAPRREGQCRWRAIRQIRTLVLNTF